MVANEKDEVVVPEEALAAAASQEALTEEDQQLLDKYSRTFIGSFSHSLDAKGRLVVPLVFRETLGDTFCIAPSYDFQSIALYPNLMWARMRDRYDKLGKMNSSLKRYLEQLDALSFRGQECDNQGRVLLPAKIRACILGDEKDAWWHMSARTSSSSSSWPTCPPFWKISVLWKCKRAFYHPLGVNIRCC